jgi:FkbM family methyltransferase
VSPDPTAQQTAVVVVLEASYLPGFEAMMHSLALTRSFVGLPLIVLTTDPEVLNDPFANAVANRMIYLGSDVIALYAGLSNARVKDSVKRSEIPKYTFIKFNVFRDLGFERIVFLDTDMLAVGNVDGILADAGDAVIAVTPLIAGKVYARTAGSKVGPSLSRNSAAHRAIAVERLEEFSRATLRKNAAFNSGVFVARKPLLHDDTFRGLIAEAAKNGGGYEQLITRDYLVGQGIDIRHLSNLYNVTRLTLEHIGPDHYRTLQDRFGFIHFTGEKPWSIPEERQNWIDGIWLDAHAAARSWVQAQIAASASAARRAYFGGTSLPKAVSFASGPVVVVDDADGTGNLLIQSGGVPRPRVTWLWREATRLPFVSVCCDVGASYGEVACSTTYRADQAIHLVEPNHRLMPYLKTSVGLHPNAGQISLHQLAASDGAGRVSFLIDRAWSGASFVAPKACADPQDPPGAMPETSLEPTDVKAAALSDIIAPAAGQSVVMRLGVGHGIGGVLAGLRALLEATEDVLLVIERPSTPAPPGAAPFSEELAGMLNVGLLLTVTQAGLKPVADREEGLRLIREGQAGEVVIARGGRMMAALRELRLPAWMPS